MASPAVRLESNYYADKLESLSDIFGAPVTVDEGRLCVGDRQYPIVDDVIVLLDPAQYPRRLQERLGASAMTQASSDYAPDIQRTFGDEWREFPDIIPAHESMFHDYFDLVDLETLREARVCDLGCGMGRWASHVAPYCREIVLVDFSEAIFVARANLMGDRNAIFLMADIRHLPFRDDFADLVFSLGVLHHLPVPALDEVRRLRRLAPRLLLYLYYALDNRPAYYRVLLRGVTAVRMGLSRVESPRARRAVTWAGAILIYRPLVGLGHVLRPVKLSKHVPLFEGYRGKGLALIRQDVYDRFFTRIEQRVTRAEVLALQDSFSTVTISPRLPYWHFLLDR